MRLLLLVPAVLVLAGCAGTAGPSTRVPTTAPTTSAQQSSTPTSRAGPPSVEVRRTPGSGAPVRPTAIMPVAPGAGRVVPVAQVDADAARGAFGGTVRVDLSGTELQIQGARGGCLDLSARLTAETTTSVTVRLTLTDTVSTPSTQSTPDAPCTRAAAPLTVELAQPLGTRTVILTQLIR